MVDNFVLVVDDEPAICKLLQEVFSREGYQVITAESAEEGLEKLKQQPVSVAFIDLKLPEMNGIEMCRRIKKEHPITCVFAVTGYISEYELAECRKAGFEDYFSKPVRMEILKKAAACAFDRHRRWEEEQPPEQ